MKKQFLLLLLLGMSISVNAQKFGKFSEDLYTQSYFPSDSSANASYVRQSVDIFYDFKSEWGIMLTMDYHFIIKIYNENGEDYAKFEIPFYADGGKRESVSSIKGVTYNQQEGEVVKTKLNKKNVYKEKTTDNWNKMVFAMPDVRAGSIVEVKYRVTSPYIFSIPKWYFQHQIPTTLSEYRLLVPSYFTLTPVATGVVPLEQNREGVSQSRHGEVRHSLKAVDVPAVKKDKYVLNSNDYRSGVKYEIMSVKWPDKPVETYSKDWNDISKTLNEHKDFGKQLDAKLKELHPIVKEAVSLEEEERKEYLYNYVRDNYIWNEKYGAKSEEGLKKFVEEKTGSIGDINLLLLNLYRKAGIESYPVVSKSRYHGLLNTHYPSLTELNYLMVYVPTDNGYLLLDASDDLTPYGDLPTRAINLYGVVIKEKSGEIFEIDNPNEFVVQTMSNYNYDEEKNQLIGQSKRKRSNYAGTRYRRKVREENDESQEKEVESVESDESDDQQDDIENYDVENVYTIKSIDNLEELSESISMEYEVEVNNSTKAVAGKLFIDATLDFGVEKNPFDTEKRAYPVFYDSKLATQTFATIEIPEGYQVESLPEPKSIALPNKGGTFRYITSQKDQSITINYALKINQTTFTPQEYEGLKEFYKIIIGLNNEKIVLTKAE